MNLSWLEGLLFGWISGLAEFLPVSAQAHQAILCRLFGIPTVSGILPLMVHIAALLALMISCRQQLKALYGSLRLSAIPKRRRRRQPNERCMLDIQLIRTAFFPLVIGFLFYPAAQRCGTRLYMVAFFLLLNGILLLIPQLLPSGNKDSRSMSRLDGALLGFGGALSVIPGISGMAAATTVCTARGADRQHSLHWALMLSIPALAFFIGFDLYDVFTAGANVHSFMEAAVCLLSAFGAYWGAYAAIRFLQFLSVKAGFSGFAYYSWGAALFTFILYLTVR